MDIRNGGRSLAFNVMHPSNPDVAVLKRLDVALSSPQSADDPIPAEMDVAARIQEAVINNDRIIEVFFNRDEMSLALAALARPEAKARLSKANHKQIQDFVDAAPAERD